MPGSRDPNRARVLCEFCDRPREFGRKCRRVDCTGMTDQNREMTFAEIAERMNITPERVRQIYEGALAKLRKRIKKEPQ